MRFDSAMRRPATDLRRREPSKNPKPISQCAFVENIFEHLSIYQYLYKRLMCVYLFVARTTVHAQRTHLVVVRIYQWLICVCWFCLLQRDKRLTCATSTPCGLQRARVRRVRMRQTPQKNASQCRDGPARRHAPSPAKILRLRHCVCAKPGKKIE